MNKFIPAELPLGPVREFIRLGMAAGATRREAKEQYRLMKTSRCYVNDLYQVQVADLPNGITHLSIKTHDKAPVHDWRHFQQIKNELTDPEREAVELYPRESRLVDTVNQYHLWVLPKGVDVPCGYWQREVTDRILMPNSKQRPLGEEHAAHQPT